METTELQARSDSPAIYGQFSLPSPIPLAAFTVAGAIFCMLGYGALWRATLRRPQ